MQLTLSQINKSIFGLLAGTILLAGYIEWQKALTIGIGTIDIILGALLTLFTMLTAIFYYKSSLLGNTATRDASVLSCVTSNVMIADTNYDITYMNGSVIETLRNAEEDLRKDLPNFNVDKLIGSNIDIFHKNPAKQRSMLDKLNSTFRTSIRVGGRTFNLIANPIIYKGKRLGTVVEWLDATTIEEEKQRINAEMNAINRSQAVIEFNMDGTIRTANDNFLNTLGYNLDEIQGKHHSMFVEPLEKNSAAYQEFWAKLNRGEYQAAEYKRIGKNGKEVWIQASYNPILDLNGKAFKVVKYATDTTDVVTTRIENEAGIKEAIQVLNDLATGNLTNKMSYEYKGAFASIKTALNSTIDKLIETVYNIKQSAEAVKTASAEISAGSLDLSQRTEEQASSLEQTAASMEQITGTVRANTQNAQQAATLAGEASEIAENGGSVVNNAVAAMSKIEDSSQKISDIIVVIDEIAFQTNLLALNAAVEAARAGEAGKGFAVVASEVRALAGRSAEASKEIKTLISASSEQVKSGASLVNKAGTTLKEIVESVRKVNGIIANIANASGEQASGIDEINGAIAQMDEVTQQNAALVEQNTAAAQSLTEQATTLEHLIAFFRVNNDSQSAYRYSAATSLASKPSSTHAVIKKPVQHSYPAKPAVKLAEQKKPTSYEDEWKEF